MKDHGTRIIIYNLWEDDQGLLELDFDSDKHVSGLSPLSNFDCFFFFLFLVARFELFSELFS